MNEKLQQCISAADTSGNTKETELRAELQLLHVKLLALRNNPMQLNHVVWRTNRPREKAKVHSDVAHGLNLEVEPRSFEHALEKLLFIIHRHMPTGERPAFDSPPLFMPQAQPSQQQQQQQQQLGSTQRQPPQQVGPLVLRTIDSDDSRSAFKRMNPTPALNPVLVGVLTPSHSKRARISSDDTADTADTATTTMINNDSQS
jgi:hypothetical protein